MIKIDFNATRTKVYWVGILFPTVLFLLCRILFITPHSSATSIPRLVSYGTEAASPTELHGRLIGKNLMASKSKKRRARMASRRINLRFEQLEARHLMSVSSPAPPMLEQMLAAPPLEQLETPPLLASNYTPMVYAGADVAVSIADGAVINGEVVANIPSNLSITWSLVSGPGSASFSDTDLPSTTITFSQAGTYELELTAENGGVVASDRVVVNVTAIDAIYIDQAWLDAQGDGPYYLDQQGKTYVLQTDVTTDGTAFAIIARDITFDLNGHTITYDNADPITVFNGSFEAGSGALADGWDFSTAPGAVRHQGVWLNNEIYDGDYSLKFSLPAGDQHVTSTSTITLEANTTYSLSAMFEYGGLGREVNAVQAKAYVRLVGTGLASKETSWDLTNNRGIQLREFEFTTGNTAETYNMEVGVSGASGVSATNYFIDDIKIQRTKTYGVTIGAQSGAPQLYPGVTQFGSGFDSTLKNGTITQGIEGATWAHAIYLRGYQGVNGTTVYDTNLIVSGANTSTIFYSDPGTRISFYNNVLTSNVQTITSRDAGNGSVISGIWGDIYDNTITNGPHIGINSPGTSNIYGNTIQLKGKYTNGFAISASKGSQIHDNIIDNGSEDYYSRGIITRGSTDPNNPARIYNNIIKVKEGINNQEYEGANIGGAYGIQLEDAKNVEVYNNDVYAFGDEVKAYAMRVNTDVSGIQNVRIYGNTFRAISSGAHAATLKFDGVEQGQVSLEDNVLVTNDGIIGETARAYFDATRSHIIVTNPINDPYILEGEWTASQEFHTQANFIDTTFVDVSSQDYFANAVFRKPHRYGVGTPDDRLAFTSSFTTTIQVTNATNEVVANASVSIENGEGTQVFSGLTDQNGQLSMVLNEFRTQGGVKTEYGPYTASVSSGSDVAQQQFDANQTQTVSIQLGTNPLSLNAVQSESGTVTPWFSTYTYNYEGPITLHGNFMQFNSRNKTVTAAVELDSYFEKSELVYERSGSDFDANQFDKSLFSNSEDVYSRLESSPDLTEEVEEHVWSDDNWGLPLSNVSN